MIGLRICNTAQSYKCSYLFHETIPHLAGAANHPSSKLPVSSRRLYSLMLGIGGVGPKHAAVQDCLLHTLCLPRAKGKPGETDHRYV